MKQIDCGFPNSMSLICLQFTSGKDFVNMTKAETYIQNSDGTPTNLQINILTQFFLTFSPINDALELLKETKAGFRIGMLYSHLNIKPNDYSYYTESSYVTFDLEVNEVTYLTLDDILAVLVGFMQITISIAEMIAGTQNEGVGQRMLNSYCVETLLGMKEKLRK